MIRKRGWWKEDDINVGGFTVPKEVADRIIRAFSETGVRASEAAKALVSLSKVSGTFKFK